MTTVKTIHNLLIIFLLLPLVMHGRLKNSENPTINNDSLSKTLLIKNKNFDSYLKLSQFYFEKEIDSATYLCRKSLKSCAARK